VTIDWRALYLAVYYVPAWIANILTMSIYFRAGFEILKSRNHLRGTVFREDLPGQDSECTRGSFAGQIMMIEDSHWNHARQDSEVSGKLPSFVRYLYSLIWEVCA